MRSADQREKIHISILGVLMPLTIAKMDGVCFCCHKLFGGSNEPFSTNKESRYCECTRPHLVRNVAEYRRLYVTVFPSPRANGDARIDKRQFPPFVPARLSKPSPDFWTIDGRDQHPELSAPTDKETEEVVEMIEEASGLFPYSKPSVRVGNPTLRTLYEQTSKQNGKKLVVEMLDLSTFNWSHTLKDARSLAIVNVAVEKQKHHLALWSAGNAALSLAIAVNNHNAACYEDQRIIIHALVSRGTSPSILNALRSFGVMLTEVAVNQPIESDHVFEMVKKKYKELTQKEILAESYWEVTDGWDGVGVLMYRLLFGQLVKETDPNVVVVPCGSGSLMVGAFLGINDVEDRTARKTLPTDCRLIGAIPYGSNVLRGIIRGTSSHDFIGPEANTQHWPQAPKTAVAHSALAPCIKWMLSGKNDPKQLLRQSSTEHIDNNEMGISFFQIKREEQLAAANWLRTLALQSGRPIAWEPSGLLQFAAVRRLIAQAGNLHEDLRICVVNTGHGIVGEREHDMMHVASHIPTSAI